jgi:hypothetical protein
MPTNSFIMKCAYAARALLDRALRVATHVEPWIAFFVVADSVVRSIAKVHILWN